MYKIYIFKKNYLYRKRRMEDKREKRIFNFFFILILNQKILKFYKYNLYYIAYLLI